MFYVGLKARNGYCPRCKKRTDERFRAVILDAEPIHLEPSPAHAAWCKPCFRKAGIELLKETRIEEYAIT